MRVLDHNHSNHCMAFKIGPTATLKSLIPPTITHKMFFSKENQFYYPHNLFAPNFLWQQRHWQQRHWCHVVQPPKHPSDSSADPCHWSPYSWKLDSIWSCVRNSRSIFEGVVLSKKKKEKRWDLLAVGWCCQIGGPPNWWSIILLWNYGFN
jgi:hypothetical protein